MRTRVNSDCTIPERRRNLCDVTSAVTAFCRGTELSEPACYRVLTTAMDVAGGRREFDISFAKFGRRMARGKGKSDDACSEMTSRDVATLEAVQLRTGIHALVVIRGDKKKGLVSKWEFPALEWIEQIHRLGVEILSRERSKSGGQRMNREACFDAAFNETEKRIPRENPKSLRKPIPKDPHSGRLNLIKSIGGIAKRLRMDAIDAGADEKAIANLRQAATRQVDRAFVVPVDMLRVKNTQPIKCTTPPPPSVFKKRGAPPRPARAGYTGGKTVGGWASETQQKRCSHEDRPNELKPEPGIAIAAVDYLASIGVRDFAVLFLDDNAPKRDALRKRLELDVNTLKQSFFGLLAEASRARESFVVDMRAGGPRIVQVDDCNELILDRFAPFSVLRIQTSEGNGQAILALPSGLSDEEYETIKRRLFATLKGSGANRGASGAARWPGSFNFKPNRLRADGSYPMVQLLGGLFGRTVTSQELERGGLLAPSEASEPLRLLPGRRSSPENLSWPQYDGELSAADRSRADFKFCTAAAELGWSLPEIEKKLSELSPKARERSPNYAATTARKATAAVESRLRRKASLEDIPREIYRSG